MSIHPYPITHYVEQATRSDLKILAAAALHITAQMSSAQDWDGGSDWLERIMDETTAARKRLSRPRTIPLPYDGSDESMFAWRLWFGPEAQPWQGTYDPTTPATWIDYDDHTPPQTTEASSPEVLAALVAQARSRRAAEQEALQQFHGDDGDVDPANQGDYDDARITWALDRVDDLDALLDQLARLGL